MGDQPEILMTAQQLSVALGVERKWILRQQAGPQPEFAAQIVGGRGPAWLWRESSLDHWRAYLASQASVPRRAGRRKPEPQETGHKGYSDHEAVNVTRADVVVTWKLWWHPLSHGGTRWYFSTPHGWFISDDDGHSWENTRVMTRPNDHHYYAISGTVSPRPALASILRSANRLRQRLEGES